MNPFYHFKQTYCQIDLGVRGYTEKKIENKDSLRQGERRGHGNVALQVAPNPFVCTLYLSKICLIQ